MESQKIKREFTNLILLILAPKKTPKNMAAMAFSSRKSKMRIYTSEKGNGKMINSQERVHTTSSPSPSKNRDLSSFGDKATGWLIK